MTAPKHDKLRLENTYDKQSGFYDGLDDENVTPPGSIQGKVEDSEASAVNIGSMSCSESSDRMGNYVWEFGFKEGLEVRSANIAY